MIKQEFPAVSVVIPSWNQGRYIGRTLESILKQDYPGQVEIIVSDGGSNDETINVLKSYGDRLIWWSAKDKGFVDAVTKGVAKATGEILAIQSSDDYYLPGAFRAMAKAFKQYPEASFVSGGDCAIDLENQIITANIGSGLITPRSILLEAVPPQHATFAKMTLFRETGGMRSEVDMCADIDQWYRLAHFTPGVYIPMYMAVYQLHPNQRTVTSDKWAPNLIEMVESCERNSIYGSRFKLNAEDKHNLYTYWRINWTFKRDPQEASSMAFKELPKLLAYDRRTRRMILGASINYSLKKVLGIDNKAPVPKDAAEIGIDLNWWK
jgi:glycosyltransferase involved in cell wall biosynthesis